MSDGPLNAELDGLAWLRASRDKGGDRRHVIGFKSVSGAETERAQQQD